MFIATYFFIIDWIGVEFDLIWMCQKLISTLHIKLYYPPHLTKMFSWN